MDKWSDIKQLHRFCWVTYSVDAPLAVWWSQNLHVEEVWFTHRLQEKWYANTNTAKIAEFYFKLMSTGCQNIGWYGKSLRKIGK